MYLPVPNDKEVQRFKLLYKERFSVTLTDAEALDTATRLLQLFYLTSHAIYSLRKEK